MKHYSIKSCGKAHAQCRMCCPKVAEGMIGNQRTLGFKHKIESKLAIQQSTLGNQRTRGKQYNKNGRAIDRDGYVWVRISNDVDKDGHVLWKQEHRVIWESANGPIPRGLVIHHINHICSDNRLDNLAAMTKSEHRRLHMMKRSRNGLGQVTKSNA